MFFMLYYLRHVLNERRLIMAFIDEIMKTGTGKKVHVRVPSHQGGTDRTVYIDGCATAYYLGRGNNEVYRAGNHVADNLRDLVENILWPFLNYKRCIKLRLFFYKFLLIL